MNLFYSDKNVDTKKLTASFGWAPSEIYLQHDVQEMCRLLIDHIETKIKDTVVDGEIGRLLEGKSLVTIKCLNIDFESKRTESFYDIQLNFMNLLIIIVPQKY
ncbi:hypothetical protein HZS_3688 [Henneguya salminicola]|nr:hypothetical protein HZS_3688 [Henneguya salminicola]